MKLTLDLISRQLFQSLCYGVTLNITYIKTKQSRTHHFGRIESKLINTGLRLRKTVV